LLSNARLVVMLQFSFSNPDVVPAVAKRMAQETPEEQVKRKSYSNGVVLIEPTERCSLAKLLGELEAAGYEMVDAFYKKRIDAKDPHGKRMYHMSRFLFARREFVELSDEFKKVREAIRTELRSICESAMWRVRSFSNPFYKNGVEIPNQRAVSINLEGRRPLFNSAGNRLKVWQRNTLSEKVGTAPLPIQPTHELRIIYSALALKPFVA
jgi:hypothetical protein